MTSPTQVRQWTAAWDRTETHRTGSDTDHLYDLITTLEEELTMTKAAVARLTIPVPHGRQQADEPTRPGGHLPGPRRISQLVRALAAAYL
nr:hypothetical protein [Streptomyces sp. TLI_235]